MMVGGIVRNALKDNAKVRRIKTPIRGVVRTGQGKKLGSHDEKTW